MIFALLFGVLGTVAILIWDVESDFQKWQGNKDVIHAKEAWHRVGLLLFPYLGFALYQASFTIQHFHLVLVILISGITPGLMIFFFYWSFFDGLYNAFRDQDWWSNGAAHGKMNDSKLDVWLRKLPDWVEGSLKINGMLIFLLLYMIFCQ